MMRLLALCLLCPSLALAQPVLPLDVPDYAAIQTCDVIVAGQTQTLTGPASSLCTVVRQGGTLNLKAGAKFSVGTLQVQPGGTLNCDPGVEITVKDVVPPAGDPGQYGTGIMQLGGGRCAGTPKTVWTRLTAETAAGTTTVQVEQANGWKVGDLLAVADSRERVDESAAQPQAVSITAITGTALTLSVPLVVPRHAARNAAGVLERYPHIGNLTRDVVIRSENPAGFRGHVIMIGNGGDIFWLNTEFRDLGRTTMEPTSATNLLGRYSLHAHYLDGGLLLEGNAVHRCSPSRWGITIHHSHGKTIRSNVVYDCNGWGIGSEDGTEHSNVFDGNLVIRSVGLPGGRADGLRGNFGSCYWFERTANTVTNNVGANCRNGFTTFSGFQPIATFENNEAYGNDVGLEPWDTGAGTIAGFKGWHNTQMDLNLYPTVGLTIADFYSRGDPRLAHPQPYLHKNWAGDYSQVNLTLLRANIQNKIYGLHAPYGFAGGQEPWQPSTARVEGSVFCGNGTDLLWQQDLYPPSYIGTNPAMTLIAKGNTNCAGQPVPVTRRGTLHPNQVGPVTILDDADGTTPPPQTATITVNPSQTLQTIVGWEGAVLRSVQDYSSITPAQWGAIFDLAVKDLGYTRARLEAGAAIEGSGGGGNTVVNDNGDPNVINPSGFNWTSFDQELDIITIYRQKILASGQQPYISLLYVDFGGQVTAHHQPAEYAEFLLTVFQHIQTRHGWTPQAVESALEPNDTLWTAQILGPAIAAAAARLSAAGFTPDFVSPSTSNLGSVPGYANVMMAIPGAAAAIKEFSYHRYGGNDPASLQAIVDVAVKYGKRTSMLEYWGDFSTPNSGANFRMLHLDVSDGRNSSWQQGAFADAYGCVSQIIRVVNGVPEMCPNSRVTSRYTKFIRPGMVRVGAATTNAGFSPVAFRDAGGRYVVVVKAEGVSGAFSVAGLPAGTYGVSWAYENGQQMPQDLPDVTITAGQNLTTSIPAGGAITIAAKTGTTPPPDPDTDGDLIPDSKDKCPTVPAPGTADGCPVTPPPQSFTLAHLGNTRDMVSPGRVLKADGITDPTFTVTFPTSQTVTRVRVTASVGGAWDTDPTQTWIVCVAQSATGPCVNATNGTVSTTGTVFSVYVAEGGVPRFPAGSSATVTATVGGVNLVQTVKIATTPPPDPCVAVPLTVTVTGWPDAASGTRTMAYAASHALAGMTLTANLTRAVFTDQRGCSVTKIK